ncbi:YlmC/YmxH family sporulation protein [Brevibacillus borstelensis]|uniref:YlmC/YmxH family sporulation protein n=1 Tax=Brevibacillus borstelensis TaxID=45462 RepID=UPI00203D5A8E|nr:YlmC/YmxH family sporulation protein [Brevibacillus borstelensis]MCM3470008.1 YlmC/YmxH family sporulation protein [Brevibacillus borstelensis]
MRLSEMSGKEIIGLDNGERLGVIGDSDLEINTETGSIHAIIVPGGSFFGFGKKRDDMVIPWDAIVKIGPDMVIIQVSLLHKSKPLSNKVF